MIIHIAPFTAQSKEEALSRLCAQAGLIGTASALSSGKPFLKTASGPHGLSITHIRRRNPPLSLMAVSVEPQIAIDVEAWGETTDDHFIASISAPEDERAIAAFRSLGRDAGVPLWVAKEAAMKAHGEVMLDPREVALSLQSDGILQINPAKTAAAPVPQIYIKLYALLGQSGQEHLLLAVAFPPHRFPQGTEIADLKDHYWKLRPITLDSLTNL